MYEQHLKQQITNIFQAEVPLLPGASQHHRAGQPTQRLGANLSFSGVINSLNQVGWPSGRRGFRTDRWTITGDAARPGTVGRDDRGDERRLPAPPGAGRNDPDNQPTSCGLSGTRVPLAPGLQIAATKYIHAQQFCRAFTARMERLLEDCDALVSPTATTALHSIYKHETFRHAISRTLKRQVIGQSDIRARPVMVLLIGRAAVCNERSEDAE